MRDVQAMFPRPVSTAGNGFTVCAVAVLAQLP
jgi:hypothetical protein